VTYVKLVPRNCSRGRGVTPSVAELGEQCAQLALAWSTTSLECSVLPTAVTVSVCTPGLRRQCLPL
jgi:hypothetical protein